MSKNLRNIAIIAHVDYGKTTLTVWNVFTSQNGSCKEKLFDRANLPKPLLKREHARIIAYARV